MQDSVLIVEDDLDIANLIRVQADELSLHSDLCVDGESAIAKTAQHQYSLILLDVMLPGISGFDVCRRIRQSYPEQVIMMLTSRNSETDRVVGLELGADDYLTKPFSVRELQARMRAQLRRVHLLNQRPQAQHQEAVLSLGGLHIDNSRHQAHLHDRLLDLTATEFELLRFLASHPDQVFSRAQLLSSVWNYHHCGYEHTVNSHINRLRAKVELTQSKPMIIQTVWGVGYKFSQQGVCQ